MSTTANHSLDHRDRDDLDRHGPVRADVAVVGAGLAGLTAARMLRAAGRSVVVLDPQPPGGRGRTDERNGFLFNRGPHALYLGGHAARVLAGFGIRPTGGPPSADAHGLVGDRLGVLPTGAASLLRTPLLGWRGRLAVARVLGALPKVAAPALAGTTFASWLDRQKLPPDARALLEAVGRVSSYANAPDIAGADLVVGQIQMALAGGVHYIDGGWQTLVDALRTDIDVRRLTAVSVGRDGADVVVGTAEGATVVAQAAVVAAGTPDSVANLLGRRPFTVGPAVEAACLDLGTTATARPGVVLGIDRPLYLSNHCPPATLAPAGRSVVHVARYLAPGEDTGAHDQRTELEVLAAVAGLTSDTIVEHRYLHRMTVVGALATAELGGLPGRPTITAAGVPGVLLAGDWVGPSGHLLDASLASAEAAAMEAAKLCTR